MKQKYTIIKDQKNKQLIIREFAELDKAILSLLCEETYEQKMIVAAIKSGQENLISALRTNNLYPPGNLCRENSRCGYRVVCHQG